MAVLGAGNDFAEVSADHEYAAIQQLGGTAEISPCPAGITAHPYLGVNREAVQLIESMVADFLERRERRA